MGARKPRNVCHFYPRSPCGERRYWPCIFVVGRAFLSTLSLRRATGGPFFLSGGTEFLSTLSLRRATVHFDNYNLHCVISIHALLAESDEPPRVLREPAADFYPRSPCGERPLQSTTWNHPKRISIHALLAESDSKSAQNSGALLRI